MLKKVVNLSIFLLGISCLIAPMTVWASGNEHGSYRLDPNSNIGAYSDSNIPLSTLDLGMRNSFNDIGLTTLFQKVCDGDASIMDLPYNLRFQITDTLYIDRDNIELAGFVSLIEEITMKNNPYFKHGDPGPKSSSGNIYIGQREQNIALKELFQQPEMREWLKSNDQEIIQGYEIITENIRKAHSKSQEDCGDRCVELSGYIGNNLTNSPSNYDDTARNAAGMLFLLTIQDEEAYYDKDNKKIPEFLKNLRVESKTIPEIGDFLAYRISYREKSGKEILLLACNNFTKSIETSEKYPQDYGVFYIPGNPDNPYSDKVSVRTPADGTFQISQKWDENKGVFVFSIKDITKTDTSWQDIDTSIGAAPTE